jgi:MFS family permease
MQRDVSVKVYSGAAAYASLGVVRQAFSSLLSAFVTHGMLRSSEGTALTSVGLFSYMIAKLVAGPAVDRWVKSVGAANRSLVLVLLLNGVASAGVAVTAAWFSDPASPPAALMPALAMCWAGSRIVQAFGWPILTKLVAQGVRVEAHQAAWSVLSASSSTGRFVAAGLTALLSLGALPDAVGMACAAVCCLVAAFALNTQVWDVTAHPVDTAEAESPKNSKLRADGTLADSEPSHTAPDDEQETICSDDDADSDNGQEENGEVDMEAVLVSNTAEVEAAAASAGMADCRADDETGAFMASEQGSMGSEAEEGDSDHSRRRLNQNPKRNRHAGQSSTGRAHTAVASDLTVAGCVPRALVQAAQSRSFWLLLVGVSMSACITELAPLLPMLLAAVFKLPTSVSALTGALYPAGAIASVWFAPVVMRSIGRPMAMLVASALVAASLAGLGILADAVVAEQSLLASVLCLLMGVGMGAIYYMPPNLFVTEVPWARHVSATLGSVLDLVGFATASLCLGLTATALAGEAGDRAWPGVLMGFAGIAALAGVLMAAHFADRGHSVHVAERPAAAPSKPSNAQESAC